MPHRAPTSPFAFASLAALGAVVLLGAATPVRAQDATRIVAATIYPDSASVERALSVPGGTRHITIACLPESVDVSSLQVTGDPDLRVGDIRATPLPETRADDCDPSPIEAKRQEIDAQRAALEAQRDSADMALDYLKRWAEQPHGDGPPPALPAAAAAANRPGATAGELRRASLELLTERARVRRELDALDRAQSRLADDVPVERGKTGWRTVRFDVWTPGAATLRVRYGVRNTYWRPTYRASVDTARASLRLDRQADIVQASGEDWSDVHVKLSTGRVDRRIEAGTPSTWWLDLRSPEPRPVVAYATMSAPAPAPMAKAYGSPYRRSDDAPPPWSVAVAQGDFATEFDVAQPVTLASDGETHTLPVSSQTLPVALTRRTTPRTDPAVYLFAQAERPNGVWPAGPLQVLRDGAPVGRTTWNPALGDKLSVPLGQDDRMRVQVETPGAFTESKGVFGGSVEKTSTAVYAIVNQRGEPVTVDVLDAAPVSRNEAIVVTHHYDPAPATDSFDKVTGLTEWKLTVPAGRTQRVSVTHAVRYPKEAVVANLP